MSNQRFDIERSEIVKKNKTLIYLFITSTKHTGNFKDLSVNLPSPRTEQTVTKNEKIEIDNQQQYRVVKSK